MCFSCSGKEKFAILEKQEPTSNAIIGEPQFGEHGDGEMPNFDKEVEETIMFINGFQSGYQSLVDQLRKWNGGENPIHLDLWNILVTKEKELKERVKNLKTKGK